MASKRKQKKAIRRASDQRPPPIATPRPLGAAAESPIPKGAELHAQKLLHEAGSPTLAKTAVDSAAKREAMPDFRESHFALRCGFSSRQEMLAASKPVTAEDGTSWWATRLKDDQWIIWNNDDMSRTSRFETLEDARRSIHTHAADRSKQERQRARGVGE